MDAGLEEMYTILYGASHTQGANYQVIKKWFKECDIIDGIRVSGATFSRKLRIRIFHEVEGDFVEYESIKRTITDFTFNQSYERMCPNFEDLTLAPFIQFIGILSRESQLSVHVFIEKFSEVKPRILQEIRQVYHGTVNFEN